MPAPAATLPAQIAASRGPLAAFVAIGMAWGGFMACLPDLKAELGASDGLMGVVLIFGSLAGIAQMALAPWLARHLGRAALPLGTAALGLAVALPAQAGTPLLFALAMVLMGGASGGVDVWMNARLATIEARARMALMNLNHAVYSFAYGGAAVAAGFARAAGLSPGQILAAVALTILALALVARERDGAIEGMGQSGPGPALPLGPIPWLAGGLVLTSFLAENAAEAWSALYIERDLGAAQGTGSAGPALLGLAMGFGRLAGHAAERRLGDQALLRYGLILAACGTALVVVAPTPGAALAGFAVMGLGVSVVAPTALQITGRLSGPEIRGRAIARATQVGYLGFFLGPPGMGLVAELVGLRASYALIAAVLLAALALRARLARHDRG